VNPTVVLEVLGAAIVGGAIGWGVRRGVVVCHRHWVARRTTVSARPARKFPLRATLAALAVVAVLGVGALGSLNGDSVMPDQTRDLSNVAFRAIRNEPFVEFCRSGGRITARIRFEMHVSEAPRLQAATSTFLRMRPNAAAAAGALLACSDGAIASLLTEDETVARQRLADELVALGWRAQEDRLSDDVVFKHNPVAATVQPGKDARWKRITLPWDEFPISATNEDYLIWPDTESHANVLALYDVVDQTSPAPKADPEQKTSGEWSRRVGLYDPDKDTSLQEVGIRLSANKHSILGASASSVTDFIKGVAALGGLLTALLALPRKLKKWARAMKPRLAWLRRQVRRQPRE
jgi:hypothetical protein